MPDVDTTSVPPTFPALVPLTLAEQDLEVWYFSLPNAQTETPDWSVKNPTDARIAARLRALPRRPALDLRYFAVVCAADDQRLRTHGPNGKSRLCAIRTQPAAPRTRKSQIK